MAFASHMSAQKLLLEDLVLGRLFEYSVSASISTSGQSNARRHITAITASFPAKYIHPELVMGRCCSSLIRSYTDMKYRFVYIAHRYFMCW